jgi:hypothetical protein
MMSFQSADSTKESFLKYAFAGIKGKDTPSLDAYTPGSPAQEPKR